MAIAQSSIQSIADTLSGEFSEYLSENYSLELNEILATAADNFIEKQLGEVEDAFFYDLALALMDRAVLSSSN